MNKYNEFMQKYNPKTADYDSLVNENKRLNYYYHPRVEPVFTQERKNGEPKTMDHYQTYSNFSYIPNKYSKVKEVLKNYYYKNEDKYIDKDNKKKYFRLQNPEINERPNEDYLENNNSTFDNKKLINYDSNLKKYNSHYKKYEDMKNNLFPPDNINETLTTKRNGNSSVKKIKDDVIGKRNEIIEKIQHCQNLLNTIMTDKRNYNKRKIKKNKVDYIDDKNNNYSTNNQRIYKNELKPKKDTNNFDNDINNDNNNNPPNNNNEIKSNKFNIINEPKAYTNFAYKKITVKYDKLNNNKKIYDTNDKDKNGLSFPEKDTQKNTIQNNINYQKDFDSSNYESFDNQEKKENKYNDYLPSTTRRKIISIYNKYDKMNKYNSNVNKKQSVENQSYNNKSVKGNQNLKYVYTKDISYNNFIRNDNKNQNDHSPKTRIIKGYRNKY